MSTSLFRKRCRTLIPRIYQKNPPKLGLDQVVMAFLEDTAINLLLIIKKTGKFRTPEQLQETITNLFDHETILSHVPFNPNDPNYIEIGIPEWIHLVMGEPWHLEVTRILDSTIAYVLYYFIGSIVWEDEMITFEDLKHTINHQRELSELVDYIQQEVTNLVTPQQKKQVMQRIEQQTSIQPFQFKQSGQEQQRGESRAHRMCQCLNSKGRRCQRVISNKLGADCRFCGVHQGCCFSHQLT